VTYFLKYLYLVSRIFGRFGCPLFDNIFFFFFFFFFFLVGLVIKLFRKQQNGREKPLSVPCSDLFRQQAVCPSFLLLFFLFYFAKVYENLFLFLSFSRIIFPLQAHAGEGPHGISHFPQDLRVQNRGQREEADTDERGAGADDRRPGPQLQPAGGGGASRGPAKEEEQAEAVLLQEGLLMVVVVFWP